MNSKDFTKKKLSVLILLLALFLLIISMTGNKAGNDTDFAADYIKHRLENRLELLDRYALQAAGNPDENLPSIEGLPDDMVIYRYINDSLQSWSNQFSIINDDISNRLVFSRLTSFNYRLTSPLSSVSDTISYINLGPKWYIVKSIDGTNNVKVIAGLEIKNTIIDDLRTSENGVNDKLRLPGRYSVQSIQHSGGSPVEIDGVPLFKIILNTNYKSVFFDNSIVRWVALILFAIVMTIYLSGRRNFRVYLVSILALTVLTAIAYLWELQMSDTSELFSPTLYADGPVLISLGALILLNTYITLLVFCTYMMRDKIINAILKKSGSKKRYLYIYIVTGIGLMAATIAYTHTTLLSLIMNSNINLELYRENIQIQYTVIAYISYTGLLFCTMLQLHALEPAVRLLFGVRYNVFSKRNLALFAFLCALYFSITAAILGFRKEQDKVQVWANRLAVERDLGLEIQLRSIEGQIATDKLIASLATIDNTQGVIHNRISEHYLPKTRQGYEMNVMIFKANDSRWTDYLNEVIYNGTPIAEGSNFMFVTTGNGRSRYVGSFVFYSAEQGLTRIILEIEPDSNREDRGYYNILGQFSNPGGINIPLIYSYAKYSGDRLISFKGNHPYPTIYSFVDKGQLQKEKTAVYRNDGNVHFIHMISTDEIIVISRPQRGMIMYFTSFSYLFLALWALLTLFQRRKDRRNINTFRNTYFKTRINFILFISSLMILMSMSIISVLFVYKRNETNLFNLMSSKISTIQALIEAKVKSASSWQDLTGQDFAAVIESIGNTTKSDITVYSPAGKVFRSTTPEIFEKMIIGSRTNQKAFHNIRHLNQRFYIHRERIDHFRYWSMYAPIFNGQGELLAIISVPYTDRNYDFQHEAIFHAALIINLFILLLIATFLFSTREVNALFSPLIEMGKKMNVADVHNLEYIIYKRDDEISSLVDAYNRMVRDLSDSTKQLAQAERDKAWSQMARQVAHEIKNPLTPIKLQIQRLIRMKQNGNPAWEERFDEVSAIVLEHIDILTETANEFSTFAKLYSEEPVLMDLDKTLKEQLVIFDNRDNIKFSYLGMENAMVIAPKPQLIRVFVNLITNAVQAVEIQQKDAEDRGEEPQEGHVLISLRNSVKDGYYDIVFDDNGPGVKEENLEKLFTPNFTTKSSGTGLGLAICRNIIEKCDGEIHYRKSFGLGGASFSVTLPKYNDL
ncbi:MAG: GHKL domain-containing protein [Bacteroidales bacterium]|nr:GHKL domain-containing protein [Bacteroidales bacterium]